MRALVTPIQNSQALPALRTCTEAHLPNKKQEKSPLLSTQLPPEKRAKRPQGSGGQAGWNPQHAGNHPCLTAVARGWAGRWQEKGRAAWESPPALRLRSDWGQSGEEQLGRDLHVQASTSGSNKGGKCSHYSQRAGGGGGAKKIHQGREAQKRWLLKPSRLPQVYEPATAGAQGRRRRNRDTFVFPCASPPAGFAGSQFPWLSFTCLPVTDQHTWNKSKGSSGRNWREMRTLCSDAPAARKNARWVLPGCTSLLKVFFKMCVFSFVS